MSEEVFEGEMTDVVELEETTTLPVLIIPGIELFGTDSETTAMMAWLAALMPEE